MASRFDIIGRKAVNTSGQLGSLYDASRDLLIKNPYAQSSKNPKCNSSSECRILRGAQSNGVIDLLKQIKFEDALLQSILLGLVEPSGISCFINYNQPVNENTRFLYYSYGPKQEKIDVRAEQVDAIVSLPSDLDNATHVVTKIIWGFEILCVIQNPNNQSADKIERLLYEISKQLPNCHQPLELTGEQERQIKELSDVTVFGSGKCVDKPNVSLLTVLTSLRDWQRNTKFHLPILYTLHSLNWLYKNQQFPELYYLSDQDNSYIAQIEPTITHLKDYFNDLARKFRIFPKTFTSSTIDGCLKDISKKCDVLLSKYEEFRTELGNILVDVRRGRRKSIEINNVIFDKRYSSLRKPEVDAFYNDVLRWLPKLELIKTFNDDKITYFNVLDILQSQSISSTRQDIDEVLEDYFSKKQSCVILWYSSDRLKREKTGEWERVYQQLISERQQQATQQILLNYVDFTQCHQELEEFTIRRLPIQPSLESRHNHPRARPLPPVPQEELPPTTSLPSQRSPPSRTEINVLILGETGVGKSTFINAFVNYLMFDTLQQAEQNEPVVLIPVSFLTTTGDQFDEFIVKFGNVDSNENHEHEGQSVTQQCKSYVFHLNDRFLLRIIDTPGMGDTRGVAQDDKNIDHILTYVNNLSHLNAVCLLLKPNTSQLTVFFRSCVNQLFTYLTPIGYNNIIFCFTNARATFFAPGDTGPLLRQMIKKEHQDDIPFEKTNTFCFDSESFRYLAARKCGVNFDDFQKQECINSWTTSVTQSVRLLNYILIRERYYLNKWQSPRKVALEISMLARPLMETLRLIIYNWKLRDIGLTDKEMVLSSNPVIGEICSNCAQSNIAQVGSFWIVEYEPMKNNTVKHCQCPFDETHFLIESTVKHVLASQPLDLSSDELQDKFRGLLLQCDRLTYYLRQKGLSDQSDLFGPILERFLEEEQQIYEKSKSNIHMNKRIRETLRSIKQIRQQNKQQLIKSNEKLSLDDVDKLINQLKTIRAVNQQLESIKTSRQLKMEANEHQIKLPPIKNKIFSEFIKSFH